MPETTAQLIARIALEEGVDPALAIALARQESGLNPKAYNGNGESSVGLFQLNQRGGLGSGYDRSTLEDPETNARIALRHLAQTQKQYPNVDAGTLAALSQRPADQASYARSINAMLGGGQGQAHQGSPFDPGATTMGPMQGGDTTVADTATSDQLTEAKRQLETWQQAATHAQSLLAVLNGADTSEMDPEQVKAQRAQLQDTLDRARAQIKVYEKQITDAAKPPTGSRIINPAQSDRYILDPQGNPVGPNPNYVEPQRTTQKTPDQIAAESSANVAQSQAATAASQASTARTTALTPYEVANQQAQAALNTFTLQQKQAEQQALAKLQELISQGVDPQKAVLQVAPDYTAYVKAIGDQLSQQLAQQRQDEEARHNQTEEQYQQDTLAETTRAHQAEEADRQSSRDQQAATAAVGVGEKFGEGLIGMLPQYRTAGFVQDLGNVANAMMTSRPGQNVTATFNPANFTPQPGELPNFPAEIERKTAEALQHISPNAARIVGRPLTFPTPEQAIAMIPPYRYGGA